MTFSQSAVEAAARAIYEHEPRTYFDEGVRWDDIGSGAQDRYRHKARHALTVALAVDGVALVPKEPTEAMIRAGHDQIDWCRNDQATHLPEHPSQTDDGVGTTCKQDICDAWSAMLAAASAEPAPALQGWRPIESAPHNTRVILAWRDWRDDAWLMEFGPATTGQRFDSGYSNLSQHGSATHWQPCPMPPAASEGEELK